MNDMEKRLESMETKLSSQSAAIAAMSEQQDIVTAQLQGLLKAIKVITAFLPMSENDVSRAWETAAGLVKPASEPDGTPSYMQPIELDEIRSVLATAGMIWRERTQGN